ncbi:hypothetical protein vseg_006453 [Gypsophila vaccaria]
MNCLKINRNKRTNSFRIEKSFDDGDRDKSPYAAKKARFPKALAERSWSGNLMPPSRNKVNKSEDYSPPVKNVKFTHFHRQESTGATQHCEANDDPATPRLVRSGGKRRDWSFEDLNALEREAKRQR